MPEKTAEKDVNKKNGTGDNRLKPPSPHRMVIAVTAVLAMIFAGGLSFYVNQKNQQLRQVEENLTAIARLKADKIAAWRAERIGDAIALMDRRALNKDIRAYLAAPGQTTADEITRRFDTLRKSYDYTEILLIDPAEKIRLSLSGHMNISHSGFTDVLAAALNSRTPVLTDLHIQENEATPHISVVAPFFAEEEPSRPVGTVVLISNAQEFLYPLIEFWPVFSRSAETLLVRRDGDQVLFLNNLRHQPDTALKLKIPLSRTDVPAVMAVQGFKGIVKGKDYRGVNVVSAMLPIPDSPWFIVSKIDEKEAFAEWYFRSAMILGLILVVIGITTVSGFAFWQQEKKKHFRTLLRSEAERRAEAERYRTTLHAIGDAVISTDNHGRVKIMNSVAEALTGWNKAEARGKLLENVFRIVNEETGQTVESPVARVLSEGVVVGLANHTVLIARDGTSRPIADSGAPIRDGAGAIIGVVLVFRDQTAERNTQKALLDSERKYRRLFKSMTDAFVAVDMTGVIQEYNPVYQAMLGYGDDELRRLTYPDLTPEKWHAFEAGIVHEQILKRGDSDVYEKEYRRRDGSVFPVELRTFLIRDDMNLPVGMWAIVRDITEQKQAEAERDRLQDQLLQAQKMEAIGRLAGGVAHDFNNMLNVILGYTELALERISSDNPMYEDLREIFDAGRRSIEITRQLLAFARKQAIAPRVLHINETLENMFKMLRRLIGENIALTWHPGTGLWYVYMDPAQIDQILANLLVNARDAIGGVGRITIETGNITLEEDYCAGHAEFIPGDFVLISVADNGRGMDKETVNRLFEPFFTTKDVGEGTGLGLATVYGIVRQNDGFINVYSEPGQGTVFNVYLPCHTGAAEVIEEQHPAELPDGHGEIVMVVEDETAVLKLAGKILTSLGYTVLTASNPAAALKLAEEHTGGIDLLVTDVVMPGMNGRDLAEKLRNRHPGLRVLFMSGYTADVIADHGILDAGIHFIQKPFNRRDLAQKVREALLE